MNWNIFKYNIRINNLKLTMMYDSPEYTCCLPVCLPPARVIATLSPGSCSRSNNIWKKPTAGAKLGDNSEFSLRLPLESKERDRCLQGGIQSRDLSGFGEPCLEKTQGGTLPTPRWRYAAAGANLAWAATFWVFPCFQGRTKPANLN